MLVYRIISVPNNGVKAKESVFCFDNEVVIVIFAAASLLRYSFSTEVRDIEQIKEALSDIGYYKT